MLSQDLSEVISRTDEEYYKKIIKNKTREKVKPNCTKLRLHISMTDWSQGTFLPVQLFLVLTLHVFVNSSQIFSGHPKHSLSNRHPRPKGITR